MNINAKETLIILIGLTGTILTTIILKNSWLNFETFSLINISIIVIVGIIALIYIVYKRIEELEEEIEKTNAKNKELDKRFKIYAELTKLDARLIALEKNGKNK